MAIPGSNTVLTMALHGTMNDVVEIRNVFQLKSPDFGTLDFADIVDDMLEWADYFAAIIAAVQNVLMIWKGFTVNTQGSAFTSGFVPLSAPVPGAVTDDILPSSIAALISFPTALPKVIGKKFIAGMNEGQTGGSGNFGSTTLADLADIATDMLVPFSATNSIYTYGTRRTQADVFTPFDSFIVRSVPSPLTRRKQGVGI